MRRVLDQLPFWCFYIHQGLITSLVLQGVVAYFRHNGLDLATLSLLWLCMLPWVGKAFWAPAAERHSIGLRGNRYLGSLVLLQFAMAATLVGLGLFAPGHSVPELLAGLVLLTFLSATHDVYADGITIGTTSTQDRPAANVAQVGGSYIGIFSGAAMFLSLTESLGWRGAWLALAALSAGLTVPIVAFCRPLARFPQHVRPRLDWAALRPLRPALGLTALYYLAMRGLLALQPVIIADQGLSLSHLGVSLAALNVIASGTGVLIGGVLARRFKGLDKLRMVMIGQATVVVLAASLAQRLGTSGWLILFAVANVAAATGFVVLYNLLMGLVRPEQPASDYALFLSMDALAAVLISLSTLRIAGVFGYAPALAMLAVVALLAVWPTHLLCRRIEGGLTNEALALSESA